MNQPLVSIVIPVYNVEVYLDRCVDSVVNQTYQNLEIILVDDGSPDRCPEMCDAWAEKDARIRVIHQKNAGQGMARNAGLDAAKGKYLFFFDSDDYVDHFIAEKCVESAEATDSDAVLFGRWDVWEDGRMKRTPLSVKNTLYFGRQICGELLPRLFTYELGLGVGACGRMYAVETLRRNQIRFPSERETASEDACMALRFFVNAAVITIVPEQLYYYCRHTDSFSRVYQEDRQEKNDVFLEDSLKFIACTGLPETVAHHLTVRYHFYTIAAMKQLMLSDLTEGRKQDALKEIFRNPVLRASLSAEVLALEKPAMRLFFCSLKLRLYWLCRMMLKFKLSKK